MTDHELVKGARVLITGGAGLIGSHISDLLVGADVGEIVIFDNFTRGRAENLTQASASGKVSVVTGDVRDQAGLAKAFTGIDFVVHLAALRLTQCAVEPRHALEVMADGTFNVLEAAVNAGVKKVVAASSATVYGMAEQFPTEETHHPYENRTLYGAMKLFNEGLLKSFQEVNGLDFVALRPFNVYGPRMDMLGAYTEVLIRWMDRIEAGKPPIIFGDGVQSMDFIFVEDVARAFVLAATAGPQANGQVFNAASGVETSLNELAAELLKVMGSDLEIEYGPVRALTAVPRRLADTRRAREVLGFEARVGLTEGLERLVTWWRKARLEVNSQPAAA